jgi:hypothetical protein
LQAELPEMTSLFGEDGPFRTTIQQLTVYDSADAHDLHCVEKSLWFTVHACKLAGLGTVGIHREFITAAARWIMEAKL